MSVALVTGAAQGLGRETALRLAAEGASVACLDIDGPAVSSVAEQITAAGRKAVACQADVASEQSVAKPAEQVAKKPAAQATEQPEAEE